MVLEDMLKVVDMVEEDRQLNEGAGMGQVDKLHNHVHMKDRMVWGTLRLVVDNQLPKLAEGNGRLLEGMSMPMVGVRSMLHMVELMDRDFLMAFASWHLNSAL